MQEGGGICRNKRWSSYTFESVAEQEGRSIAGPQRTPGVPADEGLARKKPGGYDGIVR